MTELPDPSQLTHEEKDALIRALWTQVQALTVRVATLEARLEALPKMPGNSRLPLSKGQKPNRPEKGKRHGPRAGTHRDGQRLRKRYGKVRSHLFTFFDHPEVPADNNGSERELRLMATYRKVIGGFRSKWGADLYAGVRSVIGTAARRGESAYQAIQQTLRGQVVSHPG